MLPNGQKTQFYWRTYQPAQIVSDRKNNYERIKTRKDPSQGQLKQSQISADRFGGFEWVEWHFRQLTIYMQVEQQERIVEPAGSITSYKKKQPAYIKVS